MLNRNQILIFGGLAFVFSIMYSAILGSNGILERNTLESRLKNLTEEVERLEIENMNLEAKKRYLKDDEVALAKEARKYYLLSEESKVIKFKETVTNESNERLFASDIPASQFKKNDSKELPPANLLKFFYLLGAGAVLIGVFIKFK